jgi:hypothetical protein
VKQVLPALFAAFVMLAAPSLADDTTRTVRFAAGTDSAEFSGAIGGYDTANYVFDASAGQRLSVSMSASNPQAYFNISAPGGGDAIHVGSIAGNSFSGRLQSSGRYRVEVYLMRAAARRGETSRFRLSISIRGGAVPGSDDGDFADGDAGGPDNWIVRGVPPGDRLNVRTRPLPSAAVVARIRNGTVVRNLGCRTSTASRWCRIGLGGGLRGWVNGRFLREY